MNSEPLQTYTREHRGHTITVNWYPHEDHGAPWEECDGHGPVREMRTGDKKSGEKILYNYFLYDWQAAMALAKKDGWGLSAEDLQKLARDKGKPVGSLTKGEITAEAVRHDFEYLRRWCNGDWQYTGFVVTITDPDGREVAGYDGDSCWGIELESMEEFTADAFNDAQVWLESELNEMESAACRDIVTVP